MADRSVGDRGSRLASATASIRAGSHQAAKEPGTVATSSNASPTPPAGPRASHAERRWACAPTISAARLTAGTAASNRPSR